MAKDLEAKYIRIGNDFLKFKLTNMNDKDYMNNPINGKLEKIHEIEGYKNYDLNIMSVSGYNQSKKNIQEHPQFIKMWNNWVCNSNDLNNGSLNQSAMANEYLSEIGADFDFQRAIEFLFENDAYIDFDDEGNEIAYGQDWIVNPLPNELYDFVKELIEKHNEYSDKILQFLNSHFVEYGIKNDSISQIEIASSLFFDPKDKQFKFYNGFDKKDGNVSELTVLPANQQELKILVLEKQEFITDMLKKIPEVAFKNAYEHFYSSIKEETPALKETTKIENVQKIKI